MGTDAGVTPHGRNLRELVLMDDAGMTPAAVLEATTRSAAQLMGVDDDLGTIEPGKLADLSSWTATRTSSPPCRTASTRSGSAGAGSTPGARRAPTSTFGP